MFLSVSAKKTQNGISAFATALAAFFMMLVYNSAAIFAGKQLLPLYKRSKIFFRVFTVFN